jgi:hypothetical protein
MSSSRSASRWSSSSADEPVGEHAGCSPDQRSDDVDPRVGPWPGSDGGLERARGTQRREGSPHDGPSLRRASVRPGPVAKMSCALCRRRVSAFPRRPIPGGDRRSCCDGQAGISVHADETVAVDDERASARRLIAPAFVEEQQRRAEHSSMHLGAAVSVDRRSQRAARFASGSERRLPKLAVSRSHRYATPGLSLPTRGECRVDHRACEPRRARRSLSSAVPRFRSGSQPR